jgi:hypothetical protein
MEVEAEETLSEKRRKRDREGMARIKKAVKDRARGRGRRGKN